MSTIEPLTDADHAAVGCLLLEAYADHAERMGFVVDGDLPMNFGLRYWRFRLDL